LREIRKLADSYPGNPVLISEADEPTIQDLVKMYGPNNDEIQLPMDFNFADGQPYFFFNNHDQARTWDRYGDGVHNDQIAKLMATLLLTTHATPQMYYGEEIGMRTSVP